MPGRVALVVGGDAGLAAALAGAGFAVRPVDVDAGGEADEGGPVDAVVVADLDLPEAGPFCDLDDERFDELWEQPMQRAIAALAAARRRLAGGGRVVVVTPALSQTGAAGLAAHAAAVEGVRLLAVSAALQWAADGIAVNCVAPSPGADPGATVAFLASGAAGGITGATVPVRGPGP